MIDLLERYRKDLKQRRFRIVLRLIGRNLIWWTVLATTCTLAFRYLPAIGAWIVFVVACIFFTGEAVWQVIGVWPLDDWNPLDSVSHSAHFLPWTPRLGPATEAQYEYLAGRGWRGKRNLRVHQAHELMRHRLDVELGYAYLEKHDQWRANLRADKKAIVDDFGILNSYWYAILLEYRDGDGPATDRQISFLESKGWTIPDNLTAREASDLTLECAHKEFAPGDWEMIHSSESRPQWVSDWNADTAEY